MSKEYNIVGGQYKIVHPISEWGTLSSSNTIPYKQGYDLVAIDSRGLLYYKRRNFFVRLYRKIFC